MGSYTTNSYGPIIYTSPGENQDNKSHRKPKRRKPSAYKRLNKDYGIDAHIWIATTDTVSAVRQIMSLRMKDKFLEEASQDLDDGYVARFGADVYVIKARPDTYEVYLRQGTRRKAYKRKIQAINSSKPKEEL